MYISQKYTLEKIYFGNQSLKAVGHSCQKIYNVPWSTNALSRDTDRVEILKVWQTNLPTNPLSWVGSRYAYSSKKGENMVFYQIPPRPPTPRYIDMTKVLQTKCKTCFGGPRMILHAHWRKNTFPKKEYGFFTTLADPPALGYGKRPYFFPSLLLHPSLILILI